MATPARPDLPTPIEAPPDDPVAILRSLTASLDLLPPEVHRAASYVLDHPGLIAVTSMRRLATLAGVTPNTLVRMARSIGFPGYEEFRAPFRRQAADDDVTFSERARVLQRLEHGDRRGQVVTEMAAASIGNLERALAAIDATRLAEVADLLDRAEHVVVLGVGIARPLAENFTYVARMAFDHVTSIPTLGLPIDDIGRMTDRDVLFAIAFAPYRRDTIDALRLGARRDVPIVAVTDSHASPLLPIARHAFVVPIDSPLPFSSNTAATAVLETILAALFGRSSRDVAAAVSAFHERRRAAGVYFGANGR